jgi:hypothetical protein
MRKFTMTVLMAAAVLSLAACGDDEDTVDTSGPYDRTGVTVQNAAPAPAMAPAPAPEPTPEPVRSADPVFEGSGAK